MSFDQKFINQMTNQLNVNNYHLKCFLISWFHISLNFLHGLGFRLSFEIFIMLKQYLKEHFVLLLFNRFIKFVRFKLISFVVNFVIKIMAGEI